MLHAQAKMGDWQTNLRVRAEMMDWFYDRVCRLVDECCIDGNALDEASLSVMSKLVAAGANVGTGEPAEVLYEIHVMKEEHKFILKIELVPSRLDQTRVDEAEGKITWSTQKGNCLCSLQRAHNPK